MHVGRNNLKYQMKHFPLPLKDLTDQHLYKRPPVKNSQQCKSGMGLILKEDIKELETRKTLCIKSISGFTGMEPGLICVAITTCPQNPA